MKKYIVSLTRLNPLDPLKVITHRNDIGAAPVWRLDSPSTYVAEFPFAFGYVPTQMFSHNSGEFAFALVNGNGALATEIIINTMVNDSTNLEGEISDLFLEINILPEPLFVTA